MTKILDAKAIIADIECLIKKELKLFSVKPSIVFILVGDNERSKKYISLKQKACLKVGIESKTICFSGDINQKDFLKEIDNLNENINVDGILVQLPLPKQLNTYDVLNSIKINKDIDGLSSENMFNCLSNRDCIMACIPGIILEILRRYDISLVDKTTLVCGKTDIAAPSLIAIFKDLSGNLIVTDSKAKNLKDLVEISDIVITSVNEPEIIDSSWFKEGAFCFDNGNSLVKDITALNGHRLVGDVLFKPDNCKASLITPVPGGMGPLGIVQLTYNIYKSFMHSKGGTNK